MRTRACCVGLSLLVCSLTACSSAATGGLAPAAETPGPSPLRPTGPLSPSPISSATEPTPTAFRSGNSVTDATFREVSPATLDVTVRYVYAGDQGEQVHLSAEALDSAGNKVAGISFEPIAVKAGSGAATVTMNIDPSAPWKETSTAQVRVCLYLGYNSFACRDAPFAKKWSAPLGGWPTPSPTATIPPSKCDCDLNP